jgi:hypothetical protein
MKVRSLLSVAALVTSMAVPGLAFAQDEHMIGSKAVPADQVEAVQAKCDELRKAAPAATAPAASAAPATPDATAGWSADGATIDLDNLTVGLCDEGKFTASAM